MSNTLNIGDWKNSVIISRNNFKHKSLSCWSVNPFVGCQHGCRFCYVPSVSTIKLKGQLDPLGVSDPDQEWGQYSFLRHWDEKSFVRSIEKAEQTPLAELNKDGNRAVMFSTTTDPYQTLRHCDSAMARELNGKARWMMRRMLELIRDKSTLNVRILTRSPLARNDFDIFQSFGNRLLFGMSLPTLDDSLARLYEPHAPAPSRRFETLQLATELGIPVYVAMAPTYPEQGETEIREVLEKISELDPVTVFHEPINIRADNVARMAQEAESRGITFKREVFEDRIKWVRYAGKQLVMTAALAWEVGLEDVFHSWPDSSLGSQVNRELLGSDFSEWLDIAWSQISKWPTSEYLPLAA